MMFQSWQKIQTDDSLYTVYKIICDDIPYWLNKLRIILFWWNNLNY